MPNDSVIDFWFTMGSTYTYLTVSRLHEVEAKHGVRFRWRPFHLLDILNEMKHVPFADKPAKAAYMWRDIGRRANMRGLRPKVPAPYPIPRSDRVNRVALIGLQEGWGERFIRAAYRRWFEEGQVSGSEENLAGSLEEVGQDAGRVLRLADQAESQTRLQSETAEARRLGLFGSPTFAVGGEIFWGDDRLEDAIAWHAHGKLIDAPRA